MGRCQHILTVLFLITGVAVGGLVGMSAEPEVASATLKRLIVEDPAINGRLKRIKSEESPASGSRANGNVEVYRSMRVGM